MDIYAGGISGAITDPYSEDAERHAEMYYEEIRHLSTDVERIAQNTGMSVDQIALVKNYLFMSKHSLETGFERFDPCFEIAQSWQRLAFDAKNIQPHDITLLKHELKEMSLVSQGVPQSEAHRIASQDYNYPEESRLYYEKLGYKELEENKNKNGGGVRKCKDDWGERY